MTWEIFVGITVLVGFAIAIITPILKLNSSITQLNCSINTLNKSVTSIEKKINEIGKRQDEMEIEFAKLKAEHKALQQKVDYLHH